MAIVLVVGVTIVLFVFQSSSPSSMVSNTPPEDWLIPLPDLADLEPQVAALIRDTHESLISDRTSAQAWGRYGMVLDAHKLYEQAYECYERARYLDPANTRWLYLQTIIMEFQGKDIAEIVTRLQEVAQSTERYPPVHLRIGNALVQLGKHEEARDAYRKSIELDDLFSMGHRGLGQTLISLGEIQEAIVHLERAAQLSPKDSVVFSSLAQAYARAGLKEKARTAADRTRPLEPDYGIPDTIRYEVDRLAIDSSSCAYRAERYIQSAKYEPALEEYKMIEQAHPEDEQIQLRIAQIYRKLRQPEQMITHLKKAVTLRDDLVSTHIRLGTYYNDRHEFEQAIHHFRRATIHEPDQARWRVELATALARNGNLQKAIKEFETASSRGRLSARAYTDWATTLARTGDFEQAVEHYIESVQLDPNFDEAHANLGRAYEQLGQIDKAIEAYTRAVEIDPDHRAAQRLAELQSQNP